MSVGMQLHCQIGISQHAYEYKTNVFLTSVERIQTVVTGQYLDEQHTSEEKKGEIIYFTKFCSFCIKNELGSAVVLSGFASFACKVMVKT